MRKKAFRRQRKRNQPKAILGFKCKNLEFELWPQHKEGMNGLDSCWQMSWKKISEPTFLNGLLVGPGPDPVTNIFKVN